MKDDDENITVDDEGKIRIDGLTMTGHGWVMVGQSLIANLVIAAGMVVAFLSGAESLIALNVIMALSLTMTVISCLILWLGTIVDGPDPDEQE